jgi:putative beta-barrel porin BBP2
VIGRATLAHALILLALAAGRAAAQQPSPAPSQPDQDPTTLKFGSLSIKPSVLIDNVGRDNNVFNEPVNPKSDFTMTIDPAAEVVFQPGRLKLSYKQDAEYVYYQTYSSERGTNNRISIRADVDLGILRPYAAATGLDTKDRPNHEIDVRARHKERSYFGGTTVKLFTRTTAGIEVRQNRVRYDDTAEFRGENLAQALDHTDDIVTGNVGIELTPLTSFKLDVERERDRFELEPDRNSRSYRIMPTFVFSPLGLINGTVAVGYRSFTPDDATTPVFKGFVTNVTAGFTLYEHHRFDLRAERDLSYSYEQEAPYFVGTTLSVDWTYAMTSHVDVKASAARNNMSYRTREGITLSQPDDTFFAYTVGGGYRIRPRLRVGLTGEWARRDSDRSAVRTYDNNRVYATLTWGT